MAHNQYITSEQFQGILDDLNYETCEDGKKQRLLDRATADLETDLSKKFVVPLISVDGGAYSTCRQFARNKILNLMTCKVREIIGYDKNRTLTGTIDSTERFINVHGIEYKSQIKSLLDPMIDFGFALLVQAQNAQNPIQNLGLARADNRTYPIYYDDNNWEMGI